LIQKDTTQEAKWNVEWEVTKAAQGTQQQAAPEPVKTTQSQPVQSTTNQPVK
jgi:hypothetical protein